MERRHFPSLRTPQLLAFPAGNRIKKAHTEDVGGTDFEPCFQPKNSQYANVGSGSAISCTIHLFCWKPPAEGKDSRGGAG